MALTGDTVVCLGYYLGRASQKLICSPSSTVSLVSQLRPGLYRERRLFEPFVGLTKMRNMSMNIHTSRHRYQH